MWILHPHLAFPPPSPPTQHLLAHSCGITRIPCSPPNTSVNRNCYRIALPKGEWAVKGGKVVGIHEERQLILCTKEKGCELLSASIYLLLSKILPCKELSKLSAKVFVAGEYYS